jgi:hypothetical protein
MLNGSDEIPVESATEFAHEGAPSLGRAFVGIIVISLAAAPTLLLASLVLISLNNHNDALDFAQLVSWGTLKRLLSIGGVVLLFSFLAAFAYGVLMVLLSLFRVYGWLAAMISGAVWGIGALYVGLSRDRYDSSTTAEALIPFGVTGATMGLLYWWIVVRPRRRSRIAGGHRRSAAPNGRAPNRPV